MDELTIILDKEIDIVTQENTQLLSFMQFAANKLKDNAERKMDLQKTRDILLHSNRGSVRYMDINMETALHLARLPGLMPPAFPGLSLFNPVVVQTPNTTPIPPAGPSLTDPSVNLISTSVLSRSLTPAATLISAPLPTRIPNSDCVPSPTPPAAPTSTNTECSAILPPQTFPPQPNPDHSRSHTPNIVIAESSICLPSHPPSRSSSSRPKNPAPKRVDVKVHQASSATNKKKREKKRGSLSHSPKIVAAESSICLPNPSPSRSSSSRPKNPGLSQVNVEILEASSTTNERKHGRSLGSQSLNKKVKKGEAERSSISEDPAHWSNRRDQAGSGRFVRRLPALIPMDPMNPVNTPLGNHILQSSDQVLTGGAVRSGEVELKLRQKGVQPAQLPATEADHESGDAPAGSQLRRLLTGGAVRSGKVELKLRPKEVQPAQLLATEADNESGDAPAGTQKMSEDDLKMKIIRVELVEGEPKYLINHLATEQSTWVSASEAHEKYQNELLILYENEFKWAKN